MALEIHEQNVKRFIFSLIFSILILCLIYIVSISIGSSMLPIRDVFLCLFGIECRDISESILRYRLARSSTALLTGAILALSGTLIQSIARNPLAEPYILGLSSTALTALAIAILIWPTVIAYRYYMMVIAFIGAIAGYLLTTALSVLAGSTGYSLILSGIAITSIFSGLSHVLLYIVQSKLKSPYYLLLMGSTSTALTQDVLILTSTLLCCTFFIYIFGLPKKLNVYVFGDSFVKQLGYNPKLLSIISALLASLLTGTTVAVVGIVGFIGLAAPHIARLIAGSSDHRVTLALSIFIGASLATSADILARILAVTTRQGEFPLGVVTSIIGAPFLAYLIIKSGKR
ncbi:MAG: iron ABC transporter permease [Ignisphaera sp.]